MFDNLLTHSFEPKLYLELSYFPTDGDVDLSKITEFANQHLLKRFEVSTSGLLIPVVNHAGVDFIRGGLDLDSAVDQLSRLPLVRPFLANKQQLLELNVFYQDFSSSGKIVLHNNYSLTLGGIAGCKKDNNFSRREAESLAAKLQLYSELKMKPNQTANQIQVS